MMRVQNTTGIPIIPDGKSFPWYRVYIRATPNEYSTETLCDGEVWLYGFIHDEDATDCVIRTSQFDPETWWIWWNVREERNSPPPGEVFMTLEGIAK